MIRRITMFLHRHSIARKILLKQFSLTILYIKQRNVVTLDRNFKRTQDEIARKNLRKNYRLLLFAFTSLNEPRVHFMRKPRRSYAGALTKSHARTVKCLYSHKKLNNVTPIRYTYVKHTQVVISLLRTCSNYLIAITLLSTTLSDFATLLSISTNFNT